VVASVERLTLSKAFSPARTREGLFILPPDPILATHREWAGVYHITASKDGYGPAAMNNVRVDKDFCHLIPERATITLAR
jgi:hypothetical protein